MLEPGERNGIDALIDSLDSVPDSQQFGSLLLEAQKLPQQEKSFCGSVVFSETYLYRRLNSAGSPSHDFGCQIITAIWEMDHNTRFQRLDTTLDKFKKFQIDSF